MVAKPPRPPAGSPTPRHGSKPLALCSYGFLVLQQISCLENSTEGKPLNSLKR